MITTEDNDNGIYSLKINFLCLSNIHIITRADFSFGSVSFDSVHTKDSSYEKIIDDLDPPYLELC